MTLTDSVVEMPVSGPRGPAVFLASAATFAATRTSFLGGLGGVITASDVGTTVRLSDARISRGLGIDTGAAPGLNIVSGATSVASRVLFTESVGCAVNVNGSGSALALDDALILGVNTASDGSLGLGVVVLEDAAVQFNRIAITDVAATALGASSLNPGAAPVGGRITGTDLFVQRVVVGSIPVVTSHHMLGTVNLGAGVGVGLASTVDVTHALIADCAQGFGLIGGGVLQLTRAVLTGNQQAGTISGGSMFHASDVNAAGNIDDAVLVSP